MRYCVLSVVLIISTLFSTYGKEEERALLYYYNDSGSFFLEVPTTIQITDDNEAVISQTLQALFLNEGDYRTLIPKEVSLLKVILNDHELYLELSEEILTYGGNAWEEGLINQLLMTLFQFDQVEEVTIHIEHGREFFVEGTEINGYTREEWNERKGDIYWKE